MHKHYPVMHEEVRKYVVKRILEKDADDYSVMLDCTIGTAGHSKMLLEEIRNLHM